MSDDNGGRVELYNYLNAREHLPSPVKVAQRLLYLGDLIEKATDQIDLRERQMVDAKQAYEVGFARALLRSEERSEMRRRADATVQCADLSMALDIAKQLLHSAKVRMDTLEEQVRIAQSVGAISRAEIAMNTWTQT